MKAATLFILFVAIVYTGAAFGIAYNNRPQLKYAFTVRQNIDYYTDGLSYQLWCWREYKDGSLTKTYLGDFSMRVPNPEKIERINTSLCAQ